MSEICSSTTPPADDAGRTAFDRFVDPARRRPHLWRLLLALPLGVAVLAVWLIVMFGALWLIAGLEGASSWMSRMGEPVTPTATLLLLATFVGFALGPVLAARLLHGRSAASLLGPSRRVIRHFLIAGAIVGVTYAMGLGIWSMIYDARPNLSMTLWISFLPWAVLGIAVQTLAEELVFRGYLMQQLAARFAARWVWFAVPAILFGAVHYDPTQDGAGIWVILASATLFGLIAADLTVRTGSIGAAWGFHFVNNMVAVTFLATEGTITGLALYQTPYALSDAAFSAPVILGDLALLGLAWLGVRRALAPSSTV